MKSQIHFVGFNSDEYNSAVKIWGKPDFVHRIWDIRALTEIVNGDIVIFANVKNYDILNPKLYSFDDSAIVV